MSLTLSPEQECAVATLDLYNNSTAWQTAEEALETQMIDRILGDGCADSWNDANVLCVIDEDSDAFNATTTTAFTDACQSAGGVVLVEPRVDVTCLLANTTIDVATAQRLQLSFQNIDICAAADTACTADMVDFLFLNKGRDIFDALFEAAAARNDEYWVCYDVNDCSFVRTSPGAPEVPLAQLPGCPTLAPTMSPIAVTSSGTATTAALATWFPMFSTLVWAVRAWARS